MNKVNIIFLNGVSSVGKTSVAKALQAILDEAYLHVSIDQFIDMLPQQYINHPQGIMFEKINISDNPPITKISLGKIGFQVMKGMRHAVAALAQQGNHLIIDEVLIGDELQEYRELLSAYHVFYVGLFAPLSIIETREINRQDRMPGLARWQYHSVHHNIVYDVEIDTTQHSPLESATLIKNKFKLL